ncbi:MAG: S8 family serine peptidase, partial [Thermoanaerobaculia bacterium]
SRDPRVAYVAQDGVVELAEVQTPTPGWGLDRIDQAELAPSNSYEYHLDGTGIDLYVIDTGVRSTHAEFGNRVDTVDAFTSVADAIGTEDCNGHGTHVAGVAAGSTYGVAKGVTIHPVRVLSCYGQGSISDVIAGIDWITAHYPLPRKNRPAPPTRAVANMSIDAGASQPLDDAINRAISAGVTFVVAAGNRGADACLTSPARVQAAVTVGASDATDARANFSNIGPCVDLFAPGTAIPSSFMRSDTDTIAMTGTSVAAPQVAGAAALMLQSNPYAAPKDVQATLRSAATRDRLAGVGAGSPNLMLYSAFAGSGADYPPMAEFASTCGTRQCTFNAGASADDWGIAGYSWNFGDGRGGTGITASHRYNGNPGSTFIVTLTVTDSTGQTATVQHQVQLTP